MLSQDDRPRYDAQRLAWRKSLPESLIRTLASDFLAGKIDECNYDAYQEYVVRFGEPRYFRKRLSDDIA